MAASWRGAYRKREAVVVVFVARLQVGCVCLRVRARRVGGWSAKPLSGSELAQKVDVGRLPAAADGSPLPARGLPRGSKSPGFSSP